MLIQSLSSAFNYSLNALNSFLTSVLFIKILGVPFIILFIVLGSVYFTIRFGFINIRLFKQSFKIVFLPKNIPGEHGSHGNISHYQALATSVAGTVGLGTIAGVAVAINLGGPGALFWMVFAGFFGMTSKFIEVSLAFKYRQSQEGMFTSGPFQYIKIGLANFGYRKLGLFIAFLYALFLFLACLIGSLCFQSNQLVSIFAFQSDLVFFQNKATLISAITVIVVALVTFGGIKRIARFSSSLLPFMVALYLLSCLTILFYNYDRILGALKLIFWDGVLHPPAAAGGFIGAMIAGIRRAVFANEAGIGTATIAHAPTKDGEPVRAGLAAMIEPFIDTILICFLSGLTIIITNSYDYNLARPGISFVYEAFSSVHRTLPLGLYFIVPLFSLTTIISYFYYCEIGWSYLFNHRFLWACRGLMLAAIFFSGISTNFMAIASIGDLLFMSLALINMSVLYFLHPEMLKDLKHYLQK